MSNSFWQVIVPKNWKDLKRKYDVLQVSGMKVEVRNASLLHFLLETRENPNWRHSVIAAWHQEEILRIELPELYLNWIDYLRENTDLRKLINLIGGNLLYGYSPWWINVPNEDVEVSNFSLLIQKEDLGTLDTDKYHITRGRIWIRHPEGVWLMYKLQPTKFDDDLTLIRSTNDMNGCPTKWAPFDIQDHPQI